MNTVLHTLLVPARTLLAVLHTASCSALGIVGMAVFRRSGDWVMWRVGRRLWSIPLMRHVVGTEVHVEVHPDTLALARQKRGIVLVGNHQSLLDINAAFVACPTPIVFLSKASIRKVPLLGKINEMAGTVFVERGNRSSSEKAVKQLVHTLSVGRSVLVFPEGTRSATGDLQPFQERRVSFGPSSPSTDGPDVDFRNPCPASAKRMAVASCDHVCDSEVGGAEVLRRRRHRHLSQRLGTSSRV